MYINPFLCGAIATVLVELALVILIAIWDNAKKKR